MHTKIIAGITSAALTIFTFAPVPLQAADLGGGYGGSLKDTYVAPMPVVTRSGAGPCYFRADVGGSVSRDPNTSWPVYNETFTGDANGNGIIDAGEVDFSFAGDELTNVEMDNTWMVDVGAGCGSGSRGFRGEIAFGFRGDRDIQGIPAVYNGTIIGDPIGAPTPDPIDDPLHTSIQSYTLMFNAYYDLGHYGSFVPYVGAGVGAAYHIVNEVYFTGNPNLINRIEGNRDISFAWSVMAGVGYQISDKAILDFGYRYIDMGKATSGRVDNAGFVNPRVTFDDLAAHEFKLGLRYHFGGAAPLNYASLK